MTPLVSIIIPTYNRADLISETLDSVLAQTYQNWECIVVDDGSADDTAAIIASYCKIDSRFQRFQRPKNKLKGANACRNLGFEKSKGEYLIFLDSDDLLEDTCLEGRLKIVCNRKIELENELHVFNSGLLIKGHKSKVIYNKSLNEYKSYLEMFLKTIVPWQTSAVLWDKTIFEDVGMFDEEFQRLQDVDLHTRLLLNGTKIIRVNQVDSWYRILDHASEYVTDDKLPKIIKSHVKYINKFYNYSSRNDSLISTKVMNECLKINYINVLKKYVFKDKLICFKQMMLLNKQYKILGEKLKFSLWCLSLYHLLGLNKSKGLGYYKLWGQCFN